MNYSDFYRKCIDELKHSRSESAEIDSRILIEYISGKSRNFFLSSPEFELTDSQTRQINDLISRRKNHEPIAYLTGHKESFGLDFIVNKDVLIPRPETEILVEKALNFIADSKSLKILDLGTGSGNIIISLAKNAQGDFTASDISEKALAIARQNAGKHNANVNFIKSNLFENLSGKFDLIVANLPYVPINGSDDKEIKYEPGEAIFAKDNGEEIIKKFLGQARNYINDNGLILLELDPRNAKSLAEFAAKLFANVDILSDYSDKLRFLKISG